MARFNPLTGTIEVSAPPAPKARSRKPVGEDRPAPTPKIAAPVPRNAAAAADAAASVLPLTAAARHAARLPVATYAALLGGGDAAAARTTRDAFIAWCNARPEHADWRAAWTLYSAPAPVAAAPVAAAPVAPPAPPSYLTPVHHTFIPAKEIAARVPRSSVIMAAL